MTALSLLLLNACGPGRYFEYPANNARWYPAAIDDELRSQGVVPENFDSGVVVRSSDNNAHVDTTSTRVDTYLLDGARGASQNSLLLKKVIMSEYVSSVWVEPDNGCGESGFERDTGQSCNQTSESGHYETQMIGALHFFYDDYESQDCEISISRSAPLDYSKVSTWRFREYPDAPDWSDGNTCRDVVDDETAVEGVNEIIFEEEQEQI